MEFKLTKKEKEAIAALKALEKKWPKTLWLFANGMSISIMRYLPDGKPAITNTGGMDQDYIVDSITKIHNDGGDW